MRIRQLNSFDHQMNQGTHTLQNFESLIGRGVDIMPEVVQIQPRYTANFLTDGLKRRIIEDQRSKSTASQFMVVEWNLSQRHIPRIQIVNDCNDSGVGKSDITLDLAQPYYYKNDTFVLENQQQLRVLHGPEKISAGVHRYTCQLEGNDLAKGVDNRYTRKGKVTLYRSNFHGELSFDGGFKKFNNVEVHRIYLSRQRHGIAVSSDYASQMVEIENKGKISRFKIAEPTKELLDLIMHSRNNAMIFSESNHDEQGRCLSIDENGNPNPSGDGFIKQLERFCHKLSYTILTDSLFDEAIESVIRKTGQRSGRQLTAICNRQGFKDVQKALQDSLAEKSPNGAWYFTEDGNKKIKVGRDYTMYEYHGNTLTFVEDESLSENIVNRPYIIFMDTSINADGKPNVVDYTLKGRELIQGTLAGLGGMDGRTSGMISTAVDGHEIHMITYSGAAVLNPYAGFIMQGNIVDRIA